MSTPGRLRLRAGMADTEVALRREALFRLLDTLEVGALEGVVLARASQPMPTELGTLDALHLATALLWRDAYGRELVMATHDSALALAARAHGLEVAGA